MIKTILESVQAIIKFLTTCDRKKTPPPTHQEVHGNNNNISNNNNSGNIKTGDIKAEKNSNINIGHRNESK